jgi:hypothetical protein
LIDYDYVVEDYVRVMEMNPVDVGLILHQHNQQDQVVMEYMVNNVDVNVVVEMDDDVDFEN